ncbi:glycosyltransferase family 4 protein [Ornithinimicrobium avium]|uniref:Glycosyltransferase n=1 Tax=Ornithinimicrobium avium TaxID=2283195 RepID=A0A345NPC7_9MICO|nr:glycosyltransferase family 4 protein [Ornithinimicrobium avium]AXH96885.1 glycosyltransferase [Ornithinimicrobium avium]
MKSHSIITFVSHTNKPGGGELALRRYLEATELPVRLVTMEPGGVWEGLGRETVHAKGALGLRRALRGGGLVVANSMRAAFLVALLAPRRTRLVYWVRDGLTDSAMSPLALALTKHVTARRVSHYVANSRWTAGTVQDALGVSDERIDVVYSMCGVTQEMLDRPPRTEPPAPLRLLFLGRISPWKAPDVAIRALAPLRELGIEATLTVAGGSHFGEDEYAAKVAALAGAEPGVRLLGHVDDVQALLDSHDILVHCSIVPEPFGQVIVQGLAAGLPVVGTDHGAPRELLDAAPTCVLYREGDPVALANALGSSLAHFEGLRAWGLRRSAAFTDQRAAMRADSVLDSLRIKGL